MSLPRSTSLISRRPVLLFLTLLLAGAMTSCSDRKPAGEGEGGTSAPAAKKEVMIAAAASLQDAFNEMKGVLEQEDSSITYTFSFGASNILARQVAEGSPIDLFASASKGVMDSLAGLGRIDTTTRQVFAKNRLVIIGAKEVADTAVKLEDITAARFERIALASPGVPARTYAEEALRAAKMWEPLEKRFVYGQNVRQVADYVAKGEASLGFVYESDAKQYAGKVKMLAVIDPSLHKPITYPAAIVNDARNADGARKFLTMLTGAQGRAILAKHGFTPMTP